MFQQKFPPLHDKNAQKLKDKIAKIKVAHEKNNLTRIRAKVVREAPSTI